MSRAVRLGSIFVVALTTAGVNIVSSGPASAAFVCNLTSINGGAEVCIDYDPQGYRAGYRSTFQVQGNWLDFNLVCDNGARFGTTGGAFHANRPNSWHTFVFRVRSQGRCHVTLYDRSASSQADSPSVTR